MDQDPLKKIDGNTLCQHIYAEIQADIAKLGRNPKLAIVLASNDEGSARYVQMKQNVASKLGIIVDIHQLPAEKQAAEVIDLLKKLNADTSIDGVLLQLPLYPHLDLERKLIVNTITPLKDVDGLTAANQGNLAQNYHQFYVPATVKAIMFALQEGLDAHNATELKLKLAGKHVAIVNHSNLIGRPLAEVLLGFNATVTVAHEFTEYLHTVTKIADIVVSATGKPGIITAEHLKERVIVIDAGSTKTPNGVQGDLQVNPTTLTRIAAFTPVPGGIGPLTIAFLLKNLVSAALQRP